jgi:hypothetical protein
MRKSSRRQRRANLKARERARREKESETLWEANLKVKPRIDRKEKREMKSNGLPPNFNYYDRKLSMSLSQEGLRNRLCKAQTIASAIGLQVDWDDVADCSHCLHNLVDMVCQVRNKGELFHMLSTTPESIFRNCGGGLTGCAEYQGKSYGVTENGYVVVLDVAGDLGAKGREQEG